MAVPNKNPFGKLSLLNPLLHWIRDRVSIKKNISGFFILFIFIKDRKKVWAWLETQTVYYYWEVLHNSVAIYRTKRIKVKVKDNVVKKIILQISWIRDMMLPVTVIIKKCKELLKGLHIFRYWLHDKAGPCHPLPFLDCNQK